MSETPESETVPDPTSDPLWAALQAYAFDNPESALTFSARLARENRWPIRYADAVIEEYRRFCYLAMRAGHPVTPSDEVDQAWHLHLAYSAAYRAFCEDVLQSRFDHGPTLGGVDEGAKFRDWYGETLQSYKKIFGDAPPPEIWPDVISRFAHANRFVRVNRGHYWIVPRLRRVDAILIAIGIGGLIVTLIN